MKRLPSLVESATKPLVVACTSPFFIVLRYMLLNHPPICERIRTDARTIVFLSIFRSYYSVGSPAILFYTWSLAVGRLQDAIRRGVLDETNQLVGLQRFIEKGPDPEAATFSTG